MSDAQRLVQILDLNAIRDRLNSVDPYIAEKMPRHLGNSAGRKKEPLGVYLTAQFAMSDYLRDVTHGMPAPMAAALTMGSEDLVPAVALALVSDADGPAVQAMIDVVSAKMAGDPS